ncbi:MAG: CotH kinase family protein [Oscillospiraceae bacterium]|nr:CotH kinase family protein [Oscillospiraceae bacterium]
MKLRRLLALITALVMSATFMAACNSSDSSSVADSGTGSSADSNSSKQEEKERNKVEAFSFAQDGTVTLSQERFLSVISDITMSAPEGAKIYYTTDGSTPDESAELYSEPIEFKAATSDFPNCLVLKAKAVYADGTQSDVVTHTFFSMLGIGTRFQTLVFSVSGDPDALTNGPDGIMYGDNVELRGRESERDVYVEAINPDGTVVFEQGAGVRVYGAASRFASIKSLKLFARKEYDENHGKFNIDTFGTIGADGSVMDKYDKLVLRNYGNDFQFAFIRDELNQRLAAQAGYTDVEAVVPAVVYLNGEYYGLVWLHESYCDDFFQDKYGKGAGYYEVIEGTEIEKKTDDDDPENVAAATEFNEFYNSIAYTDLTDEENYKKLCEFMDVENYLQNYALNIYVNNFDWPQNNFKCYRYYAAEGEEYGENQMDGRWRFLFHDTDYSLDLYEQDLTNAGYNNIGKIFDENSDRYSPLFVNLMKREDCKQYFLDEMVRLMDGVLSYENICETIDSMNSERYTEMFFYFDHLENLKRKDDSIWIWYDEYLRRTDNIKTFAKRRRGYVERYLIESLELSEDYFG